VCLSYFHSVNINHTQTQSWKNCHVSVFIFLPRSISSVTLFSLNLKLVSLSTCLSCWFEVSYRRVMLSVWSQCHVCKSSLSLALSHISWKYINQTTLHQEDPSWAELCTLSTQWAYSAAKNCAKLEVFLRGSLHYTILEVSMVTDSENYAKVVPNSDPICTSLKITHQGSLWSTRKNELHCDSRLHYSPKLRRSFQATYPALSTETAQSCESGMCCISLHYSKELCRPN